jgi:centromeric protein E
MVRRALQAEVAKKLMFQQAAREDAAEGGSTARKQNRRETWCPGKSAWGPPLLPSSAAGTPTHSGAPRGSATA